jgi:hypothetical protein
VQNKSANTIHYSALPPALPNSPLAEEWETYRREVGRLLSEGLEGKHVLIHHGEILGVFSTRAEATQEGIRRFFIYEPMLVRQILTYEPLLQRRLAG